MLVPPTRLHNMLVPPTRLHNMLVPPTRLHSMLVPPTRLHARRQRDVYTMVLNLSFVWKGGTRGGAIV